MQARHLLGWLMKSMSSGCPVPAEGGEEIIHQQSLNFALKLNKKLFVLFSPANTNCKKIKDNYGLIIRIFLSM